MPFCPIKLLLSRQKETTGLLQLSGTYNPNTEECDRQMCGFWSENAEMCGVAAIGIMPEINPLHPSLPDEEKPDSPTQIIKPLTKA